MMVYSKMPVLFVGHGSPLNAIEDTPFSEKWKALGQAIGKPKAIVAISAHYARKENLVNNSQNPRQIYDMYGFPKELYDIKYTPKGDPALAKRSLISSREKKMDPSELTTAFGPSCAACSPRAMSPSSNYRLTSASTRWKCTTLEISYPLCGKKVS